MMHFDTLSISYIAKYVGYKSVPTFTQLFKKQFKLTPTEYREKLQLPKKETITSMPVLAFDLYSYLTENYQMNLTEKSVSQVFYCSESKLDTLLRNEFGLTFTQLLAHIRVMYGKGLLAGTDLLIQDISTFVGFNSVRTFNRVFKEIVGTTPGSYRKYLNSET